MFSRKERNVDPASRDHDAVVNTISSHRGEGFFSVQRTFNVSFLRVAKGDVQVDRQFRRNETYRDVKRRRKFFVLQPLRGEFLTGCCAIVLIYDTFLKYAEYTDLLLQIDVFFCPC